jgi:hypothetical protein
VRDLSVIVDERLPAEQVRGTIRAVAPTTLVAVPNSIDTRVRACRTDA